MRVEAPSTFMTAHQQSKDNQRRDKLDDQNLAFSIFNESRARAKHDYQMDMGEENVRHAKTMNPLLESIKLYENEYKWGTLDTDISQKKENLRHSQTMNPLSEDFQRYRNELGWGTLESDIGQKKENLRHSKEMNPITESLGRYKDKLAWDTVDSSIARHKRETEWQDMKYNLEESRLRSDLDNMKVNRLQTTDYYGTSATEEQNKAIAENRAYKDELIGKGMKDSITEFDIKSHRNYIDERVAEHTRGRFDETYTNRRMDGLASDILAGTLDYPAKTKVNQYDLGFGDYELQKYGQGMNWQVLKKMEESRKKQEEIYERKLKLYEKADALWEAGDKEDAEDVWKQLEYMRISGVTGLMGGNNLDQYLNRGGK